MIMANETRSRRSWMNSFTSIAQVRRKNPWPLRRRGACGGEQMRHWKLSFDLPIRSMNTSSSDGAALFQVRSLRSR